MLIKDSRLLMKGADEGRKRMRRIAIRRCRSVCRLSCSPVQQTRMP